MLADGRVYSAEQAVKNGLVHEIGFVEKAIDKAIKLAGLDSEKVKVVRYKQEPSLRSLLLSGQSSKSESVELKALLEMTTPKAYYLAFLAAGTGRGGEIADNSESRRVWSRPQRRPSQNAHIGGSSLRSTTPYVFRRYRCR